MSFLRGDLRPIVRKSDKQLQAMRTSGRLLREVFDALRDRVVAGALDTDLDRFVREKMAKMKAVPAFLGYKGFPATICCSFNDEVVHGIPSGRRLKDGDIVGIDIGLIYAGYHADSAYTYAVGKISAEARRLLDVTEESLWRGIDKMREGNRLGDVSAAIQDCAEASGFGVVRDYTGHGIGREMHEPPELPNFGKAGTGKRLREGVVIAIEPMINQGTDDTLVLDDEWTVVTADGGLSAHFEHTVVVTVGGPEVLTA
jgi:methionyl aminopeptidase